MCGRTAQSYRVAAAAAENLGVPPGAHVEEETAAADSEQAESPKGPRDNYNLSPGMDAIVIWKGSDGRLTAGRKVWGLVSRGGSKNSPLPTGMSQHFSNLMFNARSDTLYAKPTFARLATGGKTCVVAVDGFFEWKQEGKGNKQPYFVRRSKSSDVPYLLLAGLWTSVPTGREADPTLDTFTILTTDVCEPLQWLHTRMPVCVYDHDLARQWLQHPSQKVHARLEQAARSTTAGVLEWYAVTKEMTSMKFRSADSMKPLPKMKTVTSFFARKDSSTPSKSSSTKRPVSSATVESKNKSTPSKSSATKRPVSSAAESSTKRPKTASAKKIDSFFSPKK